MPLIKDTLHTVKVLIKHEDAKESEEEELTSDHQRSAWIESVALNLERSIQVHYRQMKRMQLVFSDPKMLASLEAAHFEIGRASSQQCSRIVAGAATNQGLLPYVALDSKLFSKLQIGATDWYQAYSSYSNTLAYRAFYCIITRLWSIHRSRRTVGVETTKRAFQACPTLDTFLRSTTLSTYFGASTRAQERRRESSLHRKNFQYLVKVFKVGALFATDTPLTSKQQQHVQMVISLLQTLSRIHVSWIIETEYLPVLVQANVLLYVLYEHDRNNSMRGLPSQQSTVPPEIYRLVYACLTTPTRQRMQAVNSSASELLTMDRGLREQIRVLSTDYKTQQTLKDEREDGAKEEEKFHSSSMLFDEIYCTIQNATETRPLI